jgi:hypothetical protein
LSCVEVAARTLPEHDEGLVQGHRPRQKHIQRQTEPVLSIEELQGSTLSRSESDLHKTWPVMLDWGGHRQRKAGHMIQDVYIYLLNLRADLASLVYDCESCVRQANEDLGNWVLSPCGHML